MRYRLPESHRPYTDAYFLRSRHILEREDLNPRVTMQIFLRQGPGRIHGIDEAVGIIGSFAGNGGRNLTVHALPEGAEYAPLETLMLIEGPIQDFIELETLYLGVIASATSERNGDPLPDPSAVERRAAAIREMLPDKQLMYFGSRHWHWTYDEEITRAAIRGGFDSCATDAGATASGLSGGVGTIPHALVLTFAHRVGMERATAEATLAFDRHMDPSIARIALVDTFNREVTDSIATAEALGSRLWGVRLDTAGENLGQGGTPFDGRTHWTGNGVTVELVRNVREQLDAAGHNDVNIVLSSGFGDLEKIAAFKEGEARYGRLFESIGIGSLFPARFATADIVRIEGRDIAKAGRGLHPNPRLRRVL
ncbi:nicotinate phosphoribosyltransferase [Desulfobaculum xiamenense]|uniref:Nicotinate phosphoribosyltransferase n=1 Tax=Desulfobaculum xiamenense TaxID=995050 RepID=A0A846QNP3_9BACT|nr:nicotinate phosphoribosyltransferase [Desulfobaculum xiamenense]NJB68807.1 nicotinate phosphoribosyltransferase [Desulfobaculum xiamenense]